MPPVIDIPAAAAVHGPLLTANLPAEPSRAPDPPRACLFSPSRALPEPTISTRCDKWPQAGLLPYQHLVRLRPLVHSSWYRRNYSAVAH